MTLPQLECAVTYFAEIAIDKTELRVPVNFNRKELRRAQCYVLQSYSGKHQGRDSIVGLLHNSGDDHKRDKSWSVRL
jgi:hypothetical protein